MSEVQQTERKPQAKALPLSADAKTHAEVVYTPLDPGDPIETIFAGLKFRANVAVQVPLTRMVDSLLRKESQTMDGELRSRAIETKVPVVERLKTNPYFKVDGEQCIRDRPHAKVPDSPEGYRGYAISWIRLSTDARSMRDRWEMEKQLRVSCGCDKRDIDYIMPLFEMRYDELKAAADAA